MYLKAVLQYFRYFYTSYTYERQNSLKIMIYDLEWKYNQKKKEGKNFIACERTSLLGVHPFIHTWMQFKRLATVCECDYIPHRHLFQCTRDLLTCHQKLKSMGKRLALLKTCAILEKRACISAVKIIFQFVTNKTILLLHATTLTGSNFVTSSHFQLL